MSANTALHLALLLLSIVARAAVGCPADALECPAMVSSFHDFQRSESEKLSSKKPYIQKTGLACWKIPQKIQIFRRKIVLERENYQFCNVLRKGQRAYSKTKVS